MRKIAIVFNHFQIQDGVARSAIGIANELSERSLAEVTLIPLFRYDRNFNTIVSKKISVRPVFGFYFKGFNKLINIMPPSLLSKWILADQYDTIIGFCMTVPIKIVASYKGKAVKYLWMHGYDEGLSLLEYYKKAYKVVCVSKHNYLRFLNETNSTVSASYAYNLLDDVKIRNMGLEFYVKKKNVPTFVSVGRLSPEKGFLRLLNCFKKLKERGFEFEFWLIGDGAQRLVIRNAIDSMGLNENVLMTGELENPHPYTRAADVYVCSSYSEGYSTACVEAIILGTPVITTNVPGGKEIINDAEAGLLVKNAEEELYKGMEFVLKNPNIISDWKKIISSTAKKFSKENRAQMLIDTLEL